MNYREKALEVLHEMRHREIPSQDIIAAALEEAEGRWQTEIMEERDAARAEVVRLRPLAEIGAAVQRLRKWTRKEKGRATAIVLRYFDEGWRVDIYDNREHSTFSGATPMAAVDVALKGKGI